MITVQNNILVSFSTIDLIYRIGILSAALSSTSSQSSFVGAVNTFSALAAKILIAGAHLSWDRATRRLRF
jgi:hypothetical protein